MATRLVELCLLPRAHSHQFTFIRYNQGPSPSSQGPGGSRGLWAALRPNDQSPYLLSTRLGLEHCLIT